MQQNMPRDVRTGTASPSDVAPVHAVTQDQSPQQLKMLEALQEQSMRLQLHLADASEQVAQLEIRRDQASDAARPLLDKQVAAAKHDLAAGSLELAQLQQKIMKVERSMSPQTITLQSPPALASPVLSGEQIMQIVGGGAMLLIPFLLVFARNLWVRGSRRTETIDIESSPRLQRIEQAIEAIAVEVERIGEAQRFTTKVLTERQSEVLANRPAAAPLPSSRREAGSITPH